MSTPEIIAEKQKRDEITVKMQSIDFNKPGMSEYRRYLLHSLYMCLDYNRNSLTEKIEKLEKDLWGTDDELP